MRPTDSCSSRANMFLVAHLLTAGELEIQNGSMFA
jgi:hypothetical protein